MLIWSSKVCLGWTAVVTMGLAGPAVGAERTGASASEVPPHPLVAAAETLYQRGMPQACDELLKLAYVATGLTDDDLVRVQFLAAMRELDEQNQLGARRALSQALQLDRAAAPPPSSSDRLRALLDEVRAQLPPGPPAKSKEARQAAAMKAANAREPAPRVLLRAVDTLYVSLQIEGAGIVLGLAFSSTPLTAADRTHLVLRRGILAMESNENEARTAFREALGADPKAVLPDYTPPKTRGVFEEVKIAVSTLPPPSPPRPANNSQTWGLAAGGGGAALAVGGAVAGALALSAYEAEKKASASGDYDGYLRNRDAARAAVITANGLYGAGVVALGVGAFLFLNAPGDVKVWTGAGKGTVSLTVGGSFR